MVIPIHMYPIIMQKCVPFIMYCEVCRQVNCLQTCEHMSAYWAIKVYVFVKFHIHISTRMLKILREKWKDFLISFGCVLLFTSM